MRIQNGDLFQSVNTGNIFEATAVSDDSLHFERIGYMDDGDFVPRVGVPMTGIRPDWMESAMRNGLFVEMTKDSDGNLWTSDQLADLADSRV